MDEGGKGEETHPLVSLASPHIEDEDGPLPISSRMRQIRRLIAEATPFLEKRISLLLDLVNKDHTIVTQESQTLLLIWRLDGRDDHFRDSSLPSFYLCCCCLWTKCFPSHLFRRLFHSSRSVYSCIEPAYLRFVYDELSDDDIIKYLATQSQIIATSMGSSMRAVRSKDSIFLAWKDRDIVRAAESIWSDYKSTSAGFPPPFGGSGTPPDNISRSIF